MTDAIEKGIYKSVVNEYRKRVDGQRSGGLLVQRTDGQAMCASVQGCGDIS